MYTRYYLNEIPVVYSCETIQNDFQKMLQGSIRKYMVRNASETIIYIFCLEFCAVFNISVIQNCIVYTLSFK